MSNEDLFPIDKFSLNSSLILKDLPKEDMQVLSRNKTTHRYKKGQVIFRENSYPSGIFILESGMVKKYKVDESDNEYIVYICTPGEIMGFQSVLSVERYLDSAATLEDCEITFIPRKDFLGAIDKSPKLAQKLLTILSHEFGVLINTISIQAQKNVKERLIINLITLHQKFKRPDSEPDSIVIINLSRTDLAHMTGTTRETVVRILRELKDDQIIDTTGSNIIIKDHSGLVRLSSI